MANRIKFLRVVFSISIVVSLTSCYAQELVDKKEVERIIKILSADDLKGRKVFSPENDEASRFIRREFGKIGLHQFPGKTNFEDKFSGYLINPDKIIVKINDKDFFSEDIIVDGNQSKWKWAKEDVKIELIGKDESLFERYGSIKKSTPSALILVNPEHKKNFERLRDYLNGELSWEKNSDGAYVFVLTDEISIKTLNIDITQEVVEKKLTNVIGVLPGKSKKDEYVIFSAHYDHIGILDAVNGDSIANGADDDASGTTAVIALAQYFKKKNINERTLVFVAFTAEEVGGFGSKNFSKQIDPLKVTAMFNIEMIGKESKFGPNSAFITGFEKSDFGKILQKNVAGTKFSFYPDPYPEQDLFYRSDNATLAKFGVPAHSISTDQIDKDPYYHTVDDEFSTLVVQNLTQTIEAIIQGSSSIVKGLDTPTRIKE